MRAKLKEITTEYRSFADNQVLTAQNLNELVNYLNDQDRLTRICLNGVGLVCGFKVTTSFSSLRSTREISRGRIRRGRTSIQISQGVGVTTDGDILHLTKSIDNSTYRDLAIDSVNYSFYRTFEDENAQYTHFRNNNEQIELLELISQEDEAENNGQIALDDVILRDKIIVLYLDNYSEKPGVCTTTDCDSQGNLEVAKLRVLLIDQQDVRNIINAKDPTFVKFDTRASYKKLPELHLAKIAVNRSTNSNFDAVMQQYKAAILQGKIELTAAMNTIYQEFNGFINEDARNNLAQIDVKLNNQSAAYYIQYEYDWLRDLMDTYQEIKNVLFDIKAQCCPNLTAFPKHLLLGHVQETQEYSTLRHEFYKSPIIPSDFENIEKFNFLLKRFEAQINDFNPNFLKLNQSVVTKITPSTKKRILGDKAIPAYYQSSLNLMRHWNFDKTRRLMWQHNLGYHRQNLALQEPLQFSFEDKNFYRIEGIQGQNYESVHKTLDTLRKNHGLSFDIQLISTATSLEEIDLTKYECHFADLDMQYKSWQSHIACLLANVTQFFSGFSTKPNGGHNYVAVDFKNEHLANTTINTATAREISKTEATISEKFELNKNLEHVKKIQLTPYLNIGVDDLGALLQNDIEDCASQSAPQMIVNQAAFATLDDYNVRIAYPINLLFKASKIAYVIPERISRIDRIFIRDFKVTADSLCKDINKTTEEINKLFNRPNTEYTKQGYEARYVKVLDDIKELCCSAKFLETINEEMERRKKSLFERLSFRDFSQRHPGLEHWAGVQEGGTFVLVYGNNNKSDSGKVLADFALPYRCCSDCAPINFVIAERELAASFTLEKTELCVDTDQQSVDVAFHLSPNNAELSILGNPSGLKIVENKISLNTNEFSLYNQPIQFIVNGNTATQSLIFHKKPKFTPQGNLTFSKENDNAKGTLSFVNNNNFDESKHTYTWTLDKDTSIKFTGRAPVVEIPSKHFELNEKNQVELTITLEVAGGFCEAVQERFTTKFTVTQETDKKCYTIVEHNLKASISTLNQLKTDVNNDQLLYLLNGVQNQYQSILDLGEDSTTHSLGAPLSNLNELMTAIQNTFLETKESDQLLFLTILFTQCWKLILELLRCQDKLDSKSQISLDNLSRLLKDEKTSTMFYRIKELDTNEIENFKKHFIEIVENCKTTENSFCNFTSDSLAILNSL